MSALVNLALRWGFGERAARLFAWGVPVLILLALVGGVTWWIYSSGESAGAAKVEAKAAAGHAQAVAAARTDERAAQATSDRIATATAKANDAVSASATSSIKELLDVIDAAPLPASPQPALPVVNAEQLRNAINARIASANRAADRADAGP